MDHATARALADAGCMPLPEYLRLCRENGWTPGPPAPPASPRAVARAEFIGGLSRAVERKADRSAVAALWAATGRR